MLQELPDDWINGTLNTLYVVADLGLKKSGVPADLRIKRKTGKTTSVLYAEYLPAAEDDPRPNAGRTRGGAGRRITRESSTGSKDPVQAGRNAIEWVLEDLRIAKTKKEQQDQNQNHTLYAYWDCYFLKESKKQTASRGFVKWKRDEFLKWEGDGYGIKHQPWSNKSVDRITTLDLDDYWSVLNKRRTPSNDMSGTKKQQKTLLRKLLKEARKDFPHMGTLEFPEISTQRQQVRHLKREEWDQLLKKVLELSEGAGRQNLSVADYQNLLFSKANNQNQRNWVDLYDCLNLMWFFYLRAEDLPRIKSEWFQDRKDEIICFLEVTKGDRKKQETTHYRTDAIENWRRIKQRRPMGFLVFPHTKRSPGETNSTLKHTWNLLLRKALDACDPPIPSDGISMTSIRHTAFRLTLEEDPDLGRLPGIHAFAENGLTSAKMLQETYLRFIEQESTAKKTRAKIKPGNWSLHKGRVGNND